MGTIVQSASVPVAWPLLPVYHFSQERALKMLGQSGWNPLRPGSTPALLGLHAGQSGPETKRHFDVPGLPRPLVPLSVVRQQCCRQVQSFPLPQRRGAELYRLDHSFCQIMPAARISLGVPNRPVYPLPVHGRPLDHERATQFMMVLLLAPYG